MQLHDAISRAFSDHSSVDDRAASAFVSEPAFAAERVI